MIPVMTLVIPVTIPVMTPVIPVMTPVMYSCYTHILNRLSTVLIWPYHEYFLLDIIYTCAHPASPLGFASSHSPGEFHWLPWILMSRSWSLERVVSPCCWSEWRSGSVDLQQTAQSSILPGPLCASRVSFSKLVSAFYTVYSCTSLVFPQLRHSGDVILL